MGNYSRDTFDKLKHYVGVRLQQGVPLVDADWNEQEDIKKYELRAFLKWFVGNGVPKGNDGFCIVSIAGGSVNTVVLTSNKTDIGLSSVVVNRAASTAADALGFGPDNCSTSRIGSSPARLTGDAAEPFALADGMTLVVSADGLPEETVTYKASDFADISAATAGEVVAAINNVVANTTASAGTGNDFDIKGGDGTAEGAGRCLVEGWNAINESNLKYTAQPLFDNAALAAKWGVDPVKPLTPTTDPTDTVYLDVWEREVDAEEDYEHLVNPKIGIETCVRLKREWVVRVVQGKTESPSPPGDHVFYPLASLLRKPGVAAIDQHNIQDLRRSGLAVLSKELTIKDGNVGIGTPDPKVSLDVGGHVNIQDGNQSAVISFPRTGKLPNLYIRSTDNPDKWNPSDERLFIGSNGKVGIGTTTPTSLLDVKLGSIRARRDADQYIQIIDNSAGGGFITGHSRANNKKPLYIESLHDGGEGPRGETQMRFRVGNENSPTTAIMIKEDGNVGIGTNNPEAKLHVNGNLRVNVGEGLEFLGENDYFGTNLDARIFRMIDLNGTEGNVDGGIAIEGFTPTDNGRKPIMTIRGNGNVGIGTTSPAAKLHVDGDVQIGDRTVERQLTIYGPQNGVTKDGALIIRYKNDSQHLRLDSNDIDCTGTLWLNVYSKKRVSVGFTGGEGMKVYGDLQVIGSITATDKSGYVTDRFVNQSGDVLEQGDIVILSRKSVKVYYGVENNIPVPEVDLTSTAYNHRVCGIVSEILVEEEPEFPVGAEEAGAKNKSKRSVERQGVFDDGVKRLQVFSAKELEKLDRKKIGKGQIGKMVTTGCFAHCKVDADIAQIEVGDLLTTSPTQRHAQKVLEPEKAVGAIIGKALGSLKKGKGKIPVLVMLQ